MMLLPIYRSAVRQFDSRVRAVRPEQWESSTPADEWDVSRLVRHVIVGQSLVPGVLAGAAQPAGAAQRTDRQGDPTGPELVEQWASASSAAVAALTAVESFDRQVNLPDGGSSIEEFGWRLATDLTVHAWDLARAIAAPDEFPNDLLAHVLEQSKHSAEKWFPPERYRAPIPVPGCTDDLTELLALTGRNRWWRRS
jgi:uncharacterized protein (TIGR03086 family)